VIWVNRPAGIVMVVSFWGIIFYGSAKIKIFYTE
jgi:hypothetical protein